MTSNTDPAGETATGRRQGMSIVALLAVGSVLSATAAVAVWVRTTALDTEAYVATVSDLPKDPAVSTALANNVVTMMLDDTHVEEQLRQRLPDDLAFLSAPIASSIQDVAIETAEGFVSSDGFQTLWERANRAAHPAAVDVLTGESNVAAADDGKVTLDLTETAAAVRSRPEDSGLGNMLPPARDQATELVLFEVGDHGLLQFMVDLLDMAYWLLPFLAILSLGAAIRLSGDQGTWMHVGMGLTGCMAGSLVLLGLSRTIILGEVLDPVNQAAVAALWDQVFDGLANRLIALLVVSLGVHRGEVVPDGVDRGGPSERSVGSVVIVEVDEPVIGVCSLAL